MVSLSIKSLQHPIVKELLALRTSSKKRKELQTVLIIGQKMIKERKNLKLLLLETHLDPNNFPKAEKTYHVSSTIIQKITGLQASDGACATLAMPKAANLDTKKYIMALDHISDPGNLGTLLRTALAFGYEGAFLMGGADPYNDKALRAAKGATFDLPLQFGTHESFLNLLKNAKMTGFTADLSGKSLNDQPTPPSFALILGNEGSGISPVLQTHCQSIKIPMTEYVESLNVAIAGGILLYALRP